MKHIYQITAVAAMLILASCSSNSKEDYISVPDSNTASGVTSANGEADGFSYSLNNLSVNPGAVVINEGDAVVDAVGEGSIALSAVPDATAGKLAEGAVLYVKTAAYTGLLKIESANNLGGGKVELTTSQAQLGELFNGGEIEMSLDLTKAAEAQKTRAQAEYGFSHELFNLTDEYDLGSGFKFSPSAKAELSLKFKIAFNPFQPQPSGVSVVFEIRPSINPYLSFEGSLNKNISFDLADYIPESLLEMLRELSFDYDIPIELMGVQLTTLSTTIGLSNINIPNYIEINSMAASKLSFGINGSFKIGYELSINGLNVRSTPIYENGITFGMPFDIEVLGELITKTDVIIEPKITVLSGAYTITGDVAFGLSTFTQAEMKHSLPYKYEGYQNNLALALSSRGEFYAKANIDVLGLTSLEVINMKEELWNIGETDKVVTFSDLSWRVTNTTSAGVLAMNYKTNFTAGYSYLLKGKKVPSKLFISYEVYQENGTTRITSVVDQEITPFDVTDGTFSFSLDVPFVSLYIVTQKTSWLKNVTIKDEAGYAYAGFLNTSTGGVENSFKIVRP